MVFCAARLIMPRLLACLPACLHAGAACSRAPSLLCILVIYCAHVAAQAAAACPPVRRSSLLEGSSDSSDDEEMEPLFEGTLPEVQAITAVVDMLDGLGEDGMDTWWVHAARWMTCCSSGCSGWRAAPMCAPCWYMLFQGVLCSAAKLACCSGWHDVLACFSGYCSKTAAKHNWHGHVVGVLLRWLHVKRASLGRGVSETAPKDRQQQGPSRPALGPLQGTLPVLNKGLFERRALQGPLAQPLKGLVSTAPTGLRAQITRAGQQARCNPAKLASRPCTSCAGTNCWTARPWLLPQIVVSARVTLVQMTGSCCLWWTS